MDNSDAIERYIQYLVVERGVSRVTVANYKEDLDIFFKHFPLWSTNSLFPICADFAKTGTILFTLFLPFNVFT